MNGSFKRLIADRPGEGGPEVRSPYAAVAGVLCAAVSLCTLASSLALEAAPAMTAIGLSAFGLLLSFLCFAVPWERVGASLVDLAPAAATLAIAIATTTIDPTYGFYLVLVAGSVAYAFSRPGVVGFHLALIAVALVAPIALEPEGTRKAIGCALIFGPGILLVTVAGVYMRRTGDARERAYQEFANDALALTSRIRARVGPAGAGPLEAPAPMIPLRNVGVAKVVRGETNGTAPAASVRRRLSMTAIACAASVIAAVATTAAVMRDGGEPTTVKGAAPALARDAAPRTVADRPGDGNRRPHRRTRADRSPTAPETTATAPVTAAAPSQDAEQNTNGTSQPATPAPSGPDEAPVPVRPQAAEPEPELSPPTPVQQVAPAGPVHSTLGAVEQTVGPLVPDLKP